MLYLLSKLGEKLN